MVPESLRLDPLLSLLRGEGFQMAIVSDEYGGTAGVVTLEDVVEEIVGDIADEHDRHGSRLRQRPDGSWILSGLLRPDEVADATGLVLPEDEDYDTVAGLLVRELGRIPARGDQVVVPLPVVIPEDDDEEPVHENVLMRVELMDGLRADRISLRKLEDALVSTTAALWLALVLLLGNAYFVCAEFALVSARRTKVEPKAAAGSRVARTTLRAMEQLSLMIAAAQFGITVCSLGLGAVAEPAVAHVIEPLAELVHLPGSWLHPVVVRDRPGLRRLPARRARGDGAQEPRAGRARARRDGPRTTDGRDGDRAQADRPRPRLGRQRRRPAAADRAPHRGDLHLHPRGGGGDGRRVARRGHARPERVRAPLRRPRIHLAHRGRGAAAARPGRDRRPSRAGLRRRAAVRGDRLLPVPGGRRGRVAHRLPAHQGRPPGRPPRTSPGGRREVGPPPGQRPA